MTETQTPRTPLWAMSDEQLRAYAEDEFVSFEKRQLAREILNARNGLRRDDVAFAGRESE
jgi:hypothetical protein